MLWPCELTYAYGVRLPRLPKSPKFSCRMARHSLSMNFCLAMLWVFGHPRNGLVWRASEILREITEWMVSKSDSNHRFAGAVPYLRGFARILGGIITLRRLLLRDLIVGVRDLRGSTSSGFVKVRRPSCPCARGCRRSLWAFQRGPARLDLYHDKIGLSIPASARRG